MDTGRQNMLEDQQLVSLLGFWRTHIPHLGTLLAPIHKTDPTKLWSPPADSGLWHSLHMPPSNTVAETWVQKFSIETTGHGLA